LTLEKRGRDRLHIIAEILEISEGGSLKTQIMYRANLSFFQLNEYLSLLLDIDLLKETVEKGKNVYRITPKGLEYLENYYKIRGLLEKTEHESKKDEFPLVRMKR
jgi:predicted transcriptional regulator